jgi:acyl-CoA reductase-like NAD-dependent aldehyde dehydrogenase
VHTALAQGARLLAGGADRLDGELARGRFAAPTVPELGSTDVDLWREELFGPVLVVVRAEDAEAAFALAADSAYGLSAAVFTDGLGRALAAVEELDVGILYVNSETAGADPHVPFGGAKHSG